MRSLYDQEFIEAGCPTEDYDEVYEVDDTIGTWVTNMVILAVCLLTVFKLWCFSSKETKSKYMIGFFFFNGMSFGVAGLFHAIVHRRDDPSKDAFTRALFCLYGLSADCFSLAVLGLVTDSAVAWWVVFTIVASLTVYTTVFIEHFVVGVLFNLAVVFPLACIVYGIQARRSKEYKCNYVTKVFGVLFMIFGLVVQLGLRGVCGDGGYENCFEDCPLPNPMTFNHNALFHVLHLIGVILLAVSEDRKPSVRTPKDDRIAAGEEKNVMGREDEKMGGIENSEEASEA